MAQPVNFDNAATTFPKPPEVYAAVSYALEKQGGNPGRGGHPLSMAAGEAVYAARETVGNFFGVQPENVIFTSNCTHALNLAIQGVARRGGHFIISDLEHNSVARPVEALARAGKITYSVAHVYPEDARTVESFRSLITPRTQAMVFTLASNVTGQVLPWCALAKLCRERGICCIGDGAQVCGILPVTLEDGFHILCTAGHKGLYGAPGTGLLMTDGSVKIRPLMQGGTGSTSLDLSQPDFLPDALESGTVNTIGAASMRAGIRFLQRLGLERIHAYESGLCRRLQAGLERIPGAVIYRDPAASYVPLLSFNLAQRQPEQVAELLSMQGYCLRAGYHCAALAHTSLGTRDGTVRFAPSVFNRESEVDGLVEQLKKIAGN